ncbi:hypothetical protein CULCOIPH002_15400 [Corynebacterium ulcerans]|uniref:Transposase n=1 Tax=Corynebacterium ulcerans TaxID=65058 RepID=A0ABD0BHC6_CORUL|nr:hypothetical protein CULCOIPH001_10430 [Corynebacterium ulcerans]GJJ36628.1 hypothetical protein CULCOIPH002_15400 [Corynebacterium ulcerans]GJJ37668.1 hypothetical protein CULCOIPH003_02990 [Corynebacterium ulcerans]GJJ40558.1 hypothetical protein CULCOIPH004_09690 [Corynebacterium ulcerans]GJJ43614.1 hypothetical protein CULCOIPH005_18030 [Corynebacterium ulcerans]
MHLKLADNPEDNAITAGARSKYGLNISYDKVSELLGLRVKCSETVRTGTFEKLDGRCSFCGFETILVVIRPPDTQNVYRRHKPDIFKRFV